MMLEARACRAALKDSTLHVSREAAHLQMGRELRLMRLRNSSMKNSTPRRFWIPAVSTPAEPNTRPSASANAAVAAMLSVIRNGWRYVLRSRRDDSACSCRHGGATYLGGGRPDGSGLCARDAAAACAIFNYTKGDLSNCQAAVMQGKAWKE